MDLTPEQLRAIVSVDDLLERTGILPPIRASVMEALGRPATLREIAFITESDWSNVVGGLRIPVAPVEGADRRGPTPVERGRVRFLQRTARLVAGLPVEAGQPPAAPEAPLPTAAPHPPSKRIKLSSLVDSSAEAELVNLEGSEIRTMFAQYKSARGEYPHKDVEPSEEQLSAVAQLLRTGSAPYVDFALFGPHGKRALKRLSLVSFSYQVETGSWKRVEIPGPPDFATWWKCWLVFKTTLLLLGAVSTEKLEHYGEFVRTLVDMYGPDAWFLVYQADDRFRSEEIERLRRHAQISYEGLPLDARSTCSVGSAPYNPEKPWDWAFGAVLGEMGREYWDLEVHKRAVFYLTRLKTKQESLDDGTTLAVPHAEKAAPVTPNSGNKGNGGGARTPKKTKNKRKRDKDASPPNASNEVCLNFQRGRCSEPCPNGRRHVVVEDPYGGSAPGGKGSKGSKGKGRGKGK